MDIICAGRTIILSDYPHYKPHSWFILTDPEPHLPQVVAVMLRTKTRNVDDTLILKVGDHPFIKRSSAVDYSTARKFPLKEIETAFNKRRCKIGNDMSTKLLEKVRAGLLKSAHTRNAIRDYCQDRF